MKDTAKKPILVIMAAGMGSRFGGLKPVSYTHLTLPTKA